MRLCAKGALLSAFSVVPALVPHSLLHAQVESSWTIATEKDKADVAKEAAEAALDTTLAVEDSSVETSEPVEIPIPVETPEKSTANSSTDLSEAAENIVEDTGIEDSSVEEAPIASAASEQTQVDVADDGTGVSVQEPSEKSNSGDRQDVADATADTPTAESTKQAAPVEPVSLIGRSTDEHQVSIAPAINPIPQIDLEPEVLADIERQFNNILEIEENEDAFSPVLGEAYLGYGEALSRVGRLDEARDALAKALHLARVNNGVYAIEQRPVLRVLFEMHFSKGELEQAEEALKRVIWLEKKHPEDRDTYSYDMIVRLGNLYIDQYYSNPKITQENLAIVSKGIKYLSYAIKRYGDVPLEEKLMPYGEIALLQFIKSSISAELDRAFKENQRHRTFADLDRSQTSPSRKSFLRLAVGQLTNYYDKAVNEGRVDHQVHALRDLGDIYLLFNRPQIAAEFYNRAWVVAADLSENHELVKGFEQPARLPDFNYAGKRQDYGHSDRFIKVPLSFSLSRLGRVNKIYTEKGEGPYPKLVSRAKRVSKRMMFRPPIENGKMIATEDYNYDINVALRYGEKRPEDGDS